MTPSSTAEVESALAAAATLLARNFGERLGRDVPLAPMTTYRVGGPAALFVDVRTLDDLISVARVRAATHVPTLVVGRGSNMLVSDEGFSGIAITIANLADQIEMPSPDGETVLGEPGDEIHVVAGGGVVLPVLARRTAAVGITG